MCGEDEAKFVVEGDVDLRVLNQCLVATFFLESLPHIGIQVVNNTLNHSWTWIEVLSLASSLYMLFNGIWRFVYWWMWRSQPLGAIPLSNPLGMLGERYAKWLRLTDNTNIRTISTSESPIQMVVWPTANSNNSNGNSVWKGKYIELESRFNTEILKIQTLEDTVRQREEEIRVLKERLCLEGNIKADL